MSRLYKAPYQGGKKITSSRIGRLFRANGTKRQEFVFKKKLILRHNKFNGLFVDCLRIQNVLKMEI